MVGAVAMTVLVLLLVVPSVRAGSNGVQFMAMSSSSLRDKASINSGVCRPRGGGHTEGGFAVFISVFFKLAWFKGARCYYL